MIRMLLFAAALVSGCPRPSALDRAGSQFAEPAAVLATHGTNGRCTRQANCSNLHRPSNGPFCRESRISACPLPIAPFARGSWRSGSELAEYV